MDGVEAGSPSEVEVESCVKRDLQKGPAPVDIPGVEVEVESCFMLSDDVDDTLWRLSLSPPRSLFQAFTASPSLEEGLGVEGGGEKGDVLHYVTVEPLAWLCMVRASPRGAGEWCRGVGGCGVRAGWEGWGGSVGGGAHHLSALCFLPTVNNNFPI